MKARCIKTKSHEEWLNFRKGGIGSSDVATVLGLNPFSTPYQLWRNRLENAPEQANNEAMLLGHLLEDAIAQRWAIATGKEIIKASADEWIYVHPEKDYFRASPDRLFWDVPGSKREDNKCILEIKSTQRTIDPDNIPPHFFVQTQWQMFVMGMNKANLAWLTQGRDFGYVEITKDQDFCEYLSDVVERFWIDNIVGGKEPAVMNVSDVLLKFRTHNPGESVEIGEEEYKSLMLLKDVKKAIATLEEQRDELENRMKMLIGGAESLTHGGETVATWRSSKPGRKFDSKAFSAAYPEVYDDFLIDTPGTRRFVLK